MESATEDNLRHFEYKVNSLYHMKKIESILEFVDVSSLTKRDIQDTYDICVVSRAKFSTHVTVGRAFRLGIGICKTSEKAVRKFMMLTNGNFKQTNRHEVAAVIQAAEHLLDERIYVIADDCSTVSTVISKHFKCKDIVDVKNCKWCEEDPYLQNNYVYRNKIPPLSKLDKMGFNIMVSDTDIVYYRKETCTIGIKKMNLLDLKVYTMLSTVIDGISPQLALYKRFARDVKSYDLLQRAGIVPARSYCEFSAIKGEFSKASIDFCDTVSELYRDITNIIRGLLTDLKHNIGLHPLSTIVCTILLLKTLF